MKEETKEKIFAYYIGGMLTVVFVATVLYFLYKPWADVLGTNYQSAWAFGAAFGFVFSPVMSWILRPALKELKLQLVRAYVVIDKKERGKL